jgi:uncharacterized protein
MKNIILNLYLPILLGFALLASALVHSASIDCKKAKTETEKAICERGSLAWDDKLLGDLYEVVKKGIKSPSARQLFVKEQRDWLTERSVSCSDNVDCLTRAYQLRLLALKKVEASIGRPFHEQTEKGKQSLISTVNYYFPQGDKRFNADGVGAFCAAFLNDIRADKNFTYIEPVFASDDRDHPNFDKYQKSKCSKEEGPSYIETYRSLEALGDFDYRLYKLAGQEVLFARMNEVRQWGRLNQLTGGFHTVDLKNCQYSGVLSTRLKGTQGVEAIVKRGGKYYAMEVRSIFPAGDESISFHLTATNRVNKNRCAFGTYPPLKSHPKPNK